MPDLMGATNPVPGYDAGANNRISVSPGQNTNPQIQNVADPSRVGRADGKTERQDNSLQQDGRVRYDSNFQTFLQRLRGTPGAMESIIRILGRQGTVVLSGLSEGSAAEMAQLLQMMQMDEKQLLDFLLGQAKGGTRFSGALFNLLRGAYARAGSEGVRTDILQFLKSYADYSSSGHIEGNLLRNLNRMADAMPASWAERLRDLLAQLEEGIGTGDRQGSLQLLQREIFPYLSSYVERTHDMGLPRDLMSLMALDVARYENGSLERLLESFHQLSGYGTLKGQLGAVDDKTLLALLRNSQFDASTQAAQFHQQLLAAAGRALRGEGSAELQQAFQNLMAAMLINESVYMPVNHYLIPLQWDGRMLFSELWVDPDAEQEQKGGMNRQGGGVKCLFKMDVQDVGLFDVILSSRNGEVDLQISCPDRVVPFSRQIEAAMAEILERNELRPTRVSVRRMERPVALTEVFPKIFEGKNSVNVKA